MELKSRDQGVFRIHIERQVHRSSYEIYILIDYPDGSIARVKPISLDFERILEPVDPSKVYEPSLEFPYKEGESFIKALAFALTESGFRDKTISQEGEIKRMNQHLEDMREISFKFINKEVK
jgi:hypothetical protein